MVKTCKKCSQSKPISDFYPHPQMRDGHLNMCKECSIAETMRWKAIKSADPEWIEKEAQRHRDKARRYRESGRHPNLTGAAKTEVIRKYRKKYPEKALAHTAVNGALRKGVLHKLPCMVCGCPKSEAHHDDYSKPLDVIWLCPAHHAERHVELRKQQRTAK